MTPKRITYEVRDGGPGPAAGDVLYSTRSAYLVIASRAVSTRDGARRFVLSVLRFDHDAVPAGEQAGRTFTLTWNRRDRSTRQHAA